MVAVVDCTRPVQEQTNQHSSMEKVGVQADPPFGMELLAVDGLLSKGCFFPLNV